MNQATGKTRPGKVLLSYLLSRAEMALVGAMMFLFGAVVGIFVVPEFARRHWDGSLTVVQGALLGVVIVGIACSAINILAFDLQRWLAARLGQWFEKDDPQEV